MTMRSLWGIWCSICLVCFLGVVAIIGNHIGWAAALKFLVIIIGWSLVFGAIGLCIFYVSAIIDVVLGLLWVGIVGVVKTVFRKVAQLVRP